MLAFVLIFCFPLFMIANNNKRAFLEQVDNSASQLNLSQGTITKQSQTITLTHNPNPPSIEFTQYQKSWLIYRIIGEGATARVYLAQDTQTEEFKILKRYSPNYDIEKQYSILKILKEPIMYTKCPKTKSIISVTPYFQSAKNLSNVNLNQRQIKILMYKLLFQLYKIHENGIIHSDIKPANVIIDVKIKNREQVSQKVNIKIIDWNLAKTYQKGKKYDKFQGTHKYMAPQLLIQDQLYTPAIDIWSCGILMYKLIAKKHLIKSGSKQLKQIVQLFGYQRFIKYYDSLNKKADKITKKIQKIQKISEEKLSQKLSEELFSQQQILFLKTILVLEPEKRPTAKQLLKDDYFADVKQFYKPGFYKALKKNEKKQDKQNEDD